MARYSVDDLKRIKVCPILYKNKWDYLDSSSGLMPTYLYGMREVIRWYYRRGNRISPDSIATSVSFQGLKDGLDIENRIGLEMAFRNFADGSLYGTINQPHYNKELMLNLNEKGDTIHYVAPCVVKKDKTVYFISFDLGPQTPEQFLNRYETLFLTTWSFYVLDTVPVFVNLYYENKEIKEEKYKPNMEFIRYSKEKLIQIGRDLNIKGSPPSEICLHCNRSNECPEMINVKMLLKK